MTKRTVSDLDVAGKRVIVRVDFNVPLKDGVITDDNRINGALPTIKYLVENNAKVILMSHLGKVDHKDPVKTEADKAKNDMAPVAVRLQKLLPETKVNFVPVTRGKALEDAVEALQDGEIVLMQNTRYELGESKNDVNLAKYWASLGDLFVTDAFGSVHRAHASTVGIAEILPSALGFLVEKEVKFLSEAIYAPKHPFVAILGGAKVSDKIEVIKNLLKVADKVLIGGGMAFTFLKAQGFEVGKSLVELDKLDLAKELLELSNGKIELGFDVVTGKAFDKDTETNVRSFDAIPADEMGLDIGPKTVARFKEIIKDAKTVVWNGPQGVFEMEKFANGTLEVTKALADLHGKAITIVGGGDSAAAVAKFGLEDKFSHISTGGGASLEYLEGKVLPGVELVDVK